MTALWLAGGGLYLVVAVVVVRKLNNRPPCSRWCEHAACEFGCVRRFRG